MRKKNLVTGTEGQANYFSIATPKKVYSYPFPFLSMLPIPRRLMYPRVYSCPTTFFLRLLQPLPASPLPHLSYSGELASWRSIQQCQQPGEGWLSGDILRQGLLGLLLMRLGKGIGNGLINRAGFWAHGKGEVDGGCYFSCQRKGNQKPGSKALISLNASDCRMSFSSCETLRC